VAHAEIQRAREAGAEKIRFAWMGPTDRSEPYYYRLHGPTLLIEFENMYPPGRRNAGPINHIHTVYREPGNDYGEMLLKKHYEESAHHQE